MLSSIFKPLSSRRGFTMLELMVVVLIICLLAGMAIPSFSQQYQKAKISRATAELKTIKNLVELYKIENEKYPSTDKFEEIVKENGFTHWGNDMTDPWDGCYCYQVNNQKNKFVLWSAGPSGESGDDIIFTEEDDKPVKKDLTQWDNMDKSVSKKVNDGENS
ncbi:general secretion pathway protein G [Desulfohalotomaculum tongense]|uniref:type II secretion system protein GspG n=1 Tax=Desulforadius tongensis TaxID=1216062 RepID=UPI001958EB29|nr:type II secretion system protein GspG [Desulforadius tongensis]MBM7854503.1 general secretion pathway protein G [Desulforadius tongensis]